MSDAAPVALQLWQPKDDASHKPHHRIHMADGIAPGKVDKWNVHMGMPGH